MVAPTISDVRNRAVVNLAAMTLLMPGCEVDDTLILFTADDYRPHLMGFPPTITGLTPWSRAADTPTFTQGGCGIATYISTVQTAGDYTVAYTASGNSFASMTCYRIKNGSSAWQGVNSSASYTQNQPTPAIPAGGDYGALVLSAWAYFDNSPEGTAGYTMPAGWVEDFDNGNGGYGAMAYGHLAVADATSGLPAQVAVAPNANGTRRSNSTVRLAGAPDPEPPGTGWYLGSQPVTMMLGSNPADLRLVG